MTPVGIERYDELMSPVRALTESHPGIRGLLARDISPVLMHRFLIEYCSLGVQMTAPVDGWIRRAGLRCREIGLTALGDSLVKHAAHEAGHDRMFVDDTKSLIADHHARFQKTLDAGALLDRQCTAAMRRYIDLHEQTIAGPAPFAQVAIELEIERLSITLGPHLITQFQRVLGSEISGCLSFLQEHVALDVGHTALNRKLLARLLEARPEAMDVLVDTGARALGAYLDFMAECLALAGRESS
jgi:hypothetical protein